MNWAAALDVLRKGQEVANPATWKNVQAGVNSVSALLLLLVNFAPEQYKPLIQSVVNQDMLNSLAGIVLGFYNAYVTWATSKKVGPPLLKEDQQ